LISLPPKEIPTLVVHTRLHHQTFPNITKIPSTDPNPTETESNLSARQIQPAAALPLRWRLAASPRAARRC